MSARRRTSARLPGRESNVWFVELSAGVAQPCARMPEACSSASSVFRIAGAPRPASCSRTSRPACSRGRRSRGRPWRPRRSPRDRARRSAGCRRSSRGPVAIERTQDPPRAFVAAVLRPLDGAVVVVSALAESWPEVARAPPVRPGLEQDADRYGDRFSAGPNGVLRCALIFHRGRFPCCRAMLVTWRPWIRELRTPSASVGSAAATQGP